MACRCTGAGTSCLCVQLYMLVTGIRALSGPTSSHGDLSFHCVCMAARASHRCSNCSGGQLQGPRLVSCLWTSRAAKGGSQCRSWAPGGRAEEGAGRDPGSCENLWVKILVKSAEVHGSCAGCWFSSWSELMGSSAE